MGADFKPVLDGYASLRPFMFWAQTTMPTVFDDSLSYYEVLTKLAKMINVLLENTDTAEHNIEVIAETYLKLQNYVNTYFESLDVQEEVNNALDRMAEDGTLATIATPIISEYTAGHLGEVVESELPDVVVEKLPDAVEPIIEEIAPAYLSTFTDDYLDENLGAIVDNKLPSVVSEQIDGAVSRQIGQTVDERLPDEVDTYMSANLADIVSEELPPVVGEQIDEVVDEALPAFVTPYVNIQLPLIAGGWLSDHITNPSNPPIDTSLSVQNAAADSWTVGRKLYDLRSTETTMYEETKINSSTGAAESENGWTTFEAQVDHNFPVRVSYKPIEGQDLRTYAFYDGDGEFISGGTWTTNLNWTTITVTVPDIAKYIKISIDTTTADFDPDWLVIDVCDNFGQVVNAINNTVPSIFSNIAPIEVNTTASNDYEIGDIAFVANQLREFTDAVSAGDTIDDTNSTATTIAQQLKKLAVYVS